MGFEEENKNYKINEVKSKAGIQYKYIIFDNDHNELDKGITFRTIPYINNNNGILQLCVSVGTGLRNCRYYNLEDRRKSKWFETPILSNDKVVITLNKLNNPSGIIVENIFDNSNFYKEYMINFSDSEVWPLKEAKFINDSAIELTYISDNSNKVETKEIILN